jgi:hypothetical protein
MRSSLSSSSCCNMMISRFFRFMAESAIRNINVCRIGSFGLRRCASRCWRN